MDYKHLFLKLKNILNLNNCIICQIDLSTKFDVCDFCNAILPWFKLDKYYCHKCLKKLSKINNLICEVCKVNENDYFDTIFTIFNYQPPIKQMLIELKFKHKLYYAKLFTSILFQKITTQWYLNNKLPEALIPVPLHINRLKKRGFNQTVELSKSLKNIITIDQYSCIRIKDTISQTKLIKHSRTTNLQDAFITKKLPYKHIAILDDVITTGSTIKSLSSAIKKKNSSIKIDIWCIARA